MFTCHISHRNSIAILSLQKRRLLSSANQSFEHALDTLNSTRSTAVLFDLAQAGRLSFTDLGRLIESIIQVQNLFKTTIGFGAVAITGLHEIARARLQKLGLEKVVQTYATIEQALEAPTFKAQQLRGYRTIALCAQNRPKMAPLSQETAVPMLDFLGTPVLGHVVNHAARFGLADFTVNTGQFGHMFPEHFRHVTPHKMFYLHEQAWRADHRGSIGSTPANTLLQLHFAHSFFESDTIVCQGDALTTLDLAKMMAAHKSTNADVTFAVHQKETTTPALADVVILRPTAVEALAGVGKRAETTTLTDCFLMAGLNLQAFQVPHTHMPIRCGKDYFSALEHVLQTPSLGFRPTGQEIAPGRWVDDSALLARGVALPEYCHIGAMVKIDKGALLQGNCIIGAKSIIESRSVIRNSFLMRETRVQNGAVVDQMIAGPNWAINHDFADGSLQNRAPLDGTGPIHQTPKAPIRKTPRLVKKFA